jgi:sRNA-binding carbon storage regulator CsrA
MLIINRLPGETPIIGEATLYVRATAPSIQLMLAEDEHIVEFDFRHIEVAGNPSIQLKEGRVYLQRLEGERIVFAIDAPRSVRVTRP